MAKVREGRKVRKFKVEYFESDGEEIKDVRKAKMLVDSGEDVIAVGDVCLYDGGGTLRARTSKIEHIRICKGHYEFLTSSHVYIVN